MMTRKTKMIVGLGLSLIAVAGGAGVALAQSEDAVIASAKAAGTVGEQSDGYLGIAGSVGADVRAAVDAVNIKRRQIYTDIAARQNATVQEVAAARGCEQLANRVAQGQKYKVGGTWLTRSGAVQLPPVCG